MLGIFFLFGYILVLVIHVDNIDVRDFIINNFKDDNVEDIRKSIDSSIKSHDEDTLVGLGVLFELMWNNSDDSIKSTILSKIKKGLTK